MRTKQITGPGDHQGRCARTAAVQIFACSSHSLCWKPHAVLAIGLNKRGERPLITFLTARAGLVATLALLVVGTAVVMAMLRARSHRAAVRSSIVLNLISVVGVIGTAELSARLLSV